MKKKPKKTTANLQAQVMNFSGFYRGEERVGKRWRLIALFELGLGLGI